MNSLIKTLPKGTYVVGVSGGVDSMALVAMLCAQPDLTIIIAHVDHGIRKKSQQDRKFVESFAASHNVLFEYCELQLLPSTSEAAMREARYNFLRHVCKKYKAQLVLGHHLDDVLETAIINILRGTGPRGLTALQNHQSLLRPLLGVTKKQILTYARQNHIRWHEDETNVNQRYLRNFVRHSIIKAMDQNKKKKFYQFIVRQNTYNNRIGYELTNWLTTHLTVTDSGFVLPRYQLIMLPEAVAYEVLQQIMRQARGHTLERPLLSRALLFCKTGQTGKQFVLDNYWRLSAEKDDIIVEPR